MTPKYPIYIISKGRYESRLTARWMEFVGCPYRIVIEPQEYELYASVIPKEKILTLPFSNLGQGSIPARNWVWEHSISEGHERHWILDDNIDGFFRINRNVKARIFSKNIFRAMEDFTDRYENVALASPNYDYFVKTSDKSPPLIINSRTYSCILIKNDIPFRWRGRYNEDTDLSLRVLKSGFCTIQFNAFLQDKTPTLTMKGGNTDNVYTDGDERLTFATYLKEQHPDVVTVVRKFGRWHHQVDYSMFKKRNRLILKEGVVIDDKINNYGMRMVVK